MEFLKFSYLAASMPDYWELSFKTSMLSLHNRTIRSQVFRQVCDRVAGGLKGRRGKRHAAGGLRPETGGVIHIVIGKPLFFDLFHSEIACQLMDDGTDHLDVI